MTIGFHYSGDVRHLTNGERKQLKEDLEQCTHPRNWDYLDISRKKLDCAGSYDDEHGYCTDHVDIELVLDKYDIDWSGGADDVKYEPDWGKMTGGYDTLW
ncbi:MAG: hypothetical protein IJK81_13575 [Selenomonadaceae bacterium]|nr:hypothetical protein [Selenomonadaceae bacterium]